MSDPLLSLKALTVEFDGFKALNQLELSLSTGSLTSVIGPNGAGKSTMCDAIIGRVRPSAGTVVFRGEEISRLPEHTIVSKGICRKFQTPGVLAALSVLDNVAIASGDRRWWRAFGRKVDARIKLKVDETLELIGLQDRRDALAGELSHGEKQWLELGMVVATGCELLLLDEPTAGMGASETRRTAEIICGLAGVRTVLVIDHDIDFVEQLGGHVVVMHQGAVFTEGLLSEVRNNEAVASIYLGRRRA